MSGAVAAVIPARLASTRLPRKPLLAETGKPLIVHVCERVARAKSIGRVVVATDALAIRDAVVAAGFEARMTSESHVSGTDRVAEVAASLPETLLLNVQGDEPEIDPADLDRLVETMLAERAAMGTLAVPIEDEATFANPNAVKVVLDATGHALYFSRAPVPRPAGGGLPREARKHVGVYAFERATLLRFAALEPCPLEREERLEQLRALWHGIRIRVIAAARDSLGIDTREDYERFVERNRAGRGTGAREPWRAT